MLPLCARLAALRDRRRVAAGHRNAGEPIRSGHLKQDVAAPRAPTYRDFHANDGRRRYCYGDGCSRRTHGRVECARQRPPLRDPAFPALSAGRRQNAGFRETPDTYHADFFKRVPDDWSHTLWDFRNVIAAGADKIRLRRAVHALPDRRIGDRQLPIAVDRCETRRALGRAGALDLCGLMPPNELPDEQGVN